MFLGCATAFRAQVPQKGYEMGQDKWVKQGQYSNSFVNFLKKLYDYAKFYVTLSFAYIVCHNDQKLYLVSLQVAN